MSIYDLELKQADGQITKLAAWRGQVLLVVNVASRCGFTQQYEGLQKLQQLFNHRGFSVLAFPCNQFGDQEPGSNADILEFCSSKFAVTFPVFAKVEVNGDAAHPLFRQLKKAAPGLLGSEAIKWNFTKFLINSEGQVLERFAPTVTPESMVPAIEALFKASDNGRVISKNKKNGAEFKWMALAAVALYLVVQLWSTDDNAKSPNEPVSHENKSAFTLQQICRATISTLMGRSPSIINVDRVDGDVVYVSYVRPDDGTGWANRCKLDGNTVIWATETGRWRTHKADSVVTFSTSGDSLTILDSAPNGTTISKTFSLQELN